MRPVELLVVDDQVYYVFFDVYVFTVLLYGPTLKIRERHTTSDCVQIT